MSGSADRILLNPLLPCFGALLVESMYATVRTDSDRLDRLHTSAGKPL